MTTYATIADLPHGIHRGSHYAVPAGQSVVLRPDGAPWTLSVVPGSGGSVTVEVTCSPSTLHPDAMTWHAIDTAASGPMLYSFPGPVSGVRIAASDAAASAELVV
jgi:hypothetical protein